MRRILFAIILFILLIFTGVVIKQGFTFNTFEIYGVEQTIAKNDDIDKVNAEYTTLVKTTYPAAESALESSSSTLKRTKEEYENKASLINKSEVEPYEIEFLWTKIGNYAKDNYVEIKIDVTESTVSGKYDLNFSIVGAYPDVVQFIYDIENDSKLGFRVEDFDMVSRIVTKTRIEKELQEDGTWLENAVNYDVEYVEGKFVCKEIKIKLKSVDGTGNNALKNTTEQTTTNNTTNETNTTNANTTNTTSSTGTTNTTANTSTTNSTSSTNTTNSTSSSNTTSNTNTSSGAETPEVPL